MSIFLKNSGTKYHITNENTGWMAAHAPESSILKSFLLVGLFRIADLSSITSTSTVDTRDPNQVSNTATDGDPATVTARLDSLIRSYDDRLNELDVTCRTWLFKVLGLLVQEGYVRCEDLGKLEREVMDWGNGEAAGAAGNVQPRPVIDPQSAVLTNIEVLAYLTANPPRRPPNPPPNSRQWVPSPDLRDHNTVVKEIHNYVSRLSPHLYNYPKYTHRDPESYQSSTDAALPPVQSNAPTPMDTALRDLIARLQPYGLTKGEVLMILNLGVGASAPAPAQEEEDMEVDGEQGEGEEGGEEGEGEVDYGALALLDTVIEEREERLSDEDVVGVLEVIRECLVSK
ncbi:hypothetical protein BDV25DRAFT_130126 [Aspergillus avenaceus]|uniref:DNA-directed RNA polymerase III subunit RPC9 n=1 Tax=Aspergillus avenaceus TaxID=36643 RepID=A0A5N6TTN2_ASPAV|nr:hypothetical protein BDV25DRAFT_130126 [Aspergillus avenaceus]